MVTGYILIDLYPKDKMLFKMSTCENILLNGSTSTTFKHIFFSNNLSVYLQQISSRVLSRLPLKWFHWEVSFRLYIVWTTSILNECLMPCIYIWTVYRMINCVLLFDQLVPRIDTYPSKPLHWWVRMSYSYTGKKGEWDYLVYIKIIWLLLIIFM